MTRAMLSLWLLLGALAGIGAAQEPSAILVAPVPGCETSPNAPPRTWGSADYLLWWVRTGSTPPLVVTGSPTDPFPGALDQAGTRILFGNQGLRYGAANGLRLNLGGWIDCDNLIGIEAGGFLLERRTAQFSAQGDANGHPFLATPFVNALSGNANVYFIAQNFAPPAPSALLTGNVAVLSTSNLWSWEVHGVVNLARSEGKSIDFLIGFRETSLREDLSYVTNVANLAPGGASLFLTTPIAPGFTVTTFDKFATANLFNGVQIGARVSRNWGLVNVNLVGKLGMGNMHETVTIEGATTTNAPLPVTRAVGGIYAQASNIGQYSRDVFAVIPEVGLNAGIRLTPGLTARIGYTFLCLSNVARPGDQIDPQININRVPIDAAFGTPGGPNRPAFEVHGTSLWAQGINFGLEFTY